LLIESFKKGELVLDGMEIIVLENEKNVLKFELPGRSHTIPNLITKELWNDSDVEVSGYNVLHPQTSNAIIYIETKKKDAKKVLLSTIDAIKKKNDEFMKKGKKSLK
jgi:DNA-directed RNA polymerase subunit L